MKKQFLAAMMAAAMVTGLTACGGSSTPETTAAPTTAASQETTKAEAADEGEDEAKETEKAEEAAAPAASSGELIKVGIINNDPNESGYRTANDKDMKEMFTEANGYDASFAYSLKNDEQIRLPKSLSRMILTIC